MSRMYLILLCLGTLLLATAAVYAQCPEGNCDHNCKVSENASNWDWWWRFTEHWDEVDLPVDYYINQNGAADCNGDEFSAVQRGLAGWEGVHQSYWSGCYAGTTDKHSSADDGNPQTDGFNVISWEDMGNGNPLPLGRAQWWYDGSNHNYEADISFNDNAALSWSAYAADTCLAGHYDLESIAAHEFGHWMSFGHSCDTKATMYCSTSPGTTLRRSPNECDVNAMTRQYPQTDGTPKIQPGCWPAQFDDYVTSNPALGDINFDGREDIVFATYDSTVHVLDGRGKEIAGWPQTLPDRINASPALGDLNGDGWLEVVIACQNDSIYAFRHYGARTAGWPQNVGFGSDATPAIGDLDLDGTNEVVIASDSVRAWKGSDGSIVAGWPVYAGGFVVKAGPALADLNGDDSLEVVIPGANNGLHVFKPHGANLAGWPATTGREIYETPAVGDIDGDAALEIVAVAQYDSAYAWNGNGSRCAGWPLYFTSTVGNSAPSLGNLDGDAALEVVFGSDEDTVHALNGDGTKLLGWPIRVEYGVSGAAVIADIDGQDGNGENEVVFASKDGKLYAYHGDGTPTSWLFKQIGAQCTKAPAIGDVDGNNEIDVVIPEGQSNRLYAFNLGTVPGDDVYQWRMYAHDWNRTSRYGFQPTAPRPRLFVNTIEDLTDWEVVLTGSGNIYPGGPAVSPPFSMAVAGSGAAGASASAYSTYINTDFSRPYSVKFWFRYTDFSEANWLVFGHARLRIVNPSEPIYVDVAGDWSNLMPIAPLFQDFCPAGTYVQFEVRVDPAYNQIEFFANGQFLDIANYFNTVVPSNRIWLGDREYPGNTLYANYDDFEVYGYPPVVGVEEEPAPSAPLVNVLYQGYPNPMNPTASIQYSVKATGRVTLRMYDVAGRVVKVLVDEVKQASAAPYSIVWDGKNDAGASVASGVYFCMMETKNFSSTKKIVVLR